MEQFKASDEDWLVIELNAKEKFGVAFAGLCDLRDRVAALEAAPDRVLARSQTGEYLRAGTPVYLAAPAKAVPSDEELWKIWYDTQEEGAIVHFRALFDHGYQQGLAAGRAKQLAIAAELAGGAGKHTTQPAPPPEPRGCPTPGACSCPTAPIVPPELIQALQVAEEALADIGDAEREPDDDLAWAERRAAQELPRIRHALRTWRDHAIPPAATRGAGPLPQAGAEISTEEWYALKEQLWDQFETVGHQGERFMWFASFDAALDKARAVLARWGGAAVPVPVSERPWEQPGWCDAEDRCWFFISSLGDYDDDWGWKLLDRTYGAKQCHTACLPHWALPVPAAAAGDC